MPLNLPLNNTSTASFLISQDTKLNSLYRGIGSQLKSGPDIQNIVNFSKALAECSVPEGYMISNIISDIQNSLSDGKKLNDILTLLWKRRPEYFICLPIILTGLTDLVRENVDGIYSEIKKYYKGALNIVPNIAKDVLKSMGGFSLRDIGSEALNQTVDTATTLALGYMLQNIQTGLDAVEDKAMNAVSKIGRILALYMTLFVEFRWLMILIFIQNVRKQILNRVQLLTNVKKAIRGLSFEEFNPGDFRPNNPVKEFLLNNYILALSKLEQNISITNGIERKLFKTFVFDQGLNDRVIKNLEDAKKLLMSQRNKFLEKFIGESFMSVTESADTDKSWKFYLANDYSKTKLIEDLDKRTNIFWEGVPVRNSTFLETIFAAKPTGFENNKIAVNYSSVNAYDEIWLEVKTNTKLDVGDIIKDKYQFYRIRAVEKRTTLVKNLYTNEDLVAKDKFLNWYPDGYTKVELYSDGAGKIVEKRTPNSPDTGWSEGLKYAETKGNSYSSTFILMEKIYVNYKRGAVNDPLKNTNVEVFYLFDKPTNGADGNYSNLSYEFKTYEIDDAGFKIKTLPEVGDAPPFSFNLNEQGINNIRGFWTDKNYSFYLLFKTGTGNKYFKMLGTYPNIVEKESERRDETYNYLPQPLKYYFDEYRNLSNKNIGKWNLDDYLNAGGALSTFLFGRDIVKQNIYRNVGGILTYDAFLKTGADLLEAFCPLKNSIFYFYTLLNSLQNIDSEIDITNTVILRDWIAMINRVIMDTTTSMTQRNPETGEFLTIETIKNSPFFVGLLPSVLMDLDNIENLKGFALINKELGLGLSKNSEVYKSYRAFIDFIVWLRSNNLVNDCQNEESRLWEELRLTLVSTIEKMLHNEQLRSLVKPVLKNYYRRINNLIFKLMSISGYLGRFEQPYQSILTNGSSIKSLKNFFDSNGLNHYLDYIKNGQFQTFVNQNIEAWVGKWSPLINCLTKYVKGFNPQGEERIQLEKIINRLTVITRGDILTQFQLDLTGVFKSINMNFITKTPLGLKTTISSNLIMIAHAKETQKKITEKIFSLNK